MAWTDYIELLRLKFHWSFLIVIITMLFFVNEITLDLFKTLIVLYFSFNILLYGGIYTINSIVDIKSDKKHPLKKYRPIPAGKIRVTSALAFSIVLILLGLLTGWMLFNVNVFYIYLIFLFINLLYTFIIKSIPYLDLFANTVTHPLRVMMALAIINYNNIPYLLIVAYFLFGLGVVSLSRKIEKDMLGWKARKVLKHYSTNKLKLIQVLSFITIIILAIIDYPEFKLFYLLIIIIYVVFIFGIYVSNKIRTFWKVMYNWGWKNK